MTSAPTAPQLVVTNLAIRSRRQVVLRDFSLSATSGTLLWITGENGAGKSSLLRVLALRASATGDIQFTPQPSPLDIAFYSPLMGVPVNVTAESWLRFNLDICRDNVLGLDDPILPAVRPRARMTRLSTGEAKRFLLWSLLRTRRPFTFLDEPYEHLSPAAKARLTEILVARASDSVVVVATNQDVPGIPNKQVIEISG